jgi:hypothetical protein
VKHISVTPGYWGLDLRLGDGDSLWGGSLDNKQEIKIYLLQAVVVMSPV